MPLVEQAGARLCFLSPPEQILKYSSFRSHRVFDPLTGSARVSLGSHLFSKIAQPRNVSVSRRMDDCERQGGDSWSFVSGGCKSRQVL